MLAVSILALGMVLIIRSLLSGAVALNVVQSRIAAVQFLDEKMSDFLEIALKDDGVASNGGHETVAIGGIKAEYTFDIKPVDTNIAVDEDRISLITLNLKWRQDNKEREETFATYAKTKLET